MHICKQRKDTKQKSSALFLNNLDKALLNLVYYDFLYGKTLFLISLIKESTNEYKKGLTFSVNPFGAGGGGRTRTPLRATDFESVSSANSNTPALI